MFFLINIWGLNMIVNQLKDSLGVRLRVTALLIAAGLSGPLAIFLAAAQHGSWQLSCELTLSSLLFMLALSYLVLTPVFYLFGASLVLSFNRLIADMKSFDGGRIQEPSAGAGYVDEFQELRTVLFNADQKILRQAQHISQKNNELLNYAERVSQARQAADRAASEKENIVANITHELRTLLCGVVAATEMIEHAATQGISDMLMMDQSRLSPKQDSALKLVRKEVREILTIIDEVLKPSSSSMEIMVDDLRESIHDISRGDITLHIEAFNLEKAFSGTARTFRDMATKKGLAFEYKLQNNSKDSNLIYKSDWTRVSQVLGNLLSNAIRFTQQGSVTFNVEVNPTGKDNLHRIRFMVKDTGSGIAVEDQGRIFNLLQMGTDFNSRQHSGFGTGLAIAQRVSEKLGGKISFTSPKSATGSAFFLELTMETTPNLEELLPTNNEVPHQLLSTLSLKSPNGRCMEL